VLLGANWNDNTDYGTMKSTRESYSADTINYLTTDGRRDNIRAGAQIKGGFDYYFNDRTSANINAEVGNYDFSNNNSSFKID